MRTYAKARWYGYWKHEGDRTPFSSSAHGVTRNVAALLTGAEAFSLASKACSTFFQLVNSVQHYGSLKV